MNRNDLQKLSKLRRSDAKILLDAGHAEASYYLMGYAIECALKAVIAKGTQKHDFPDKRAVLDTHTHNLEDLARLSDLKKPLQSLPTTHPARIHWAVVKNWSEAGRYRHDIMPAGGKGFVQGQHGPARTYGVLTCIKAYW